MVGHRSRLKSSVDRLALPVPKCSKARPRCAGCSFAPCSCFSPLVRSRWRLVEGSACEAASIRVAKSAVSCLKRLSAVDYQNQPEPTQPNLFTVNSDGSVKPHRHVRLLDWVWARRWRTLLAWIALSLAAWGMLCFRAGYLIHAGFSYFADKLPPGFPLPIPRAYLANLWSWSVTMLGFTWFQPLLLRLDFKRSFAWIAVFTVAPLLGQISYPEGIYGMFAIAAVASTLLLIGQRTRPWFGLIAGWTYVSGALGASVYVFFGPLRYGNRVSSVILIGFVIMAANVLFGVPLIFGTKPLARRIAEAS